MPRSLWNGTIAFGAVAVPIKLYSAVESKTVHFSEVHVTDGAAIEHRTFCTKEDKEVPREEIVKGYEVRKGRYVVVDKDDIDAAGGTRSRIVDVEHFVDASAIDPIFYDKAYYVGAQDAKPAQDAFRLLHDALERTGRAAIARLTFHNREYLAAIRPHDDVLVLHTMRFADELVDASELDVPTASRKPDAREVEMAGRLIDSLHGPLEPETYKDEYRKTVLKAIERKAKGQDIEAADEPEPEPADDLMAALEASIDAGRSGGTAKGKAKAERGSGTTRRRGAATRKARA